MWSRTLKLEGENEVKGAGTNLERKGNFIFILTSAGERLGKMPEGVWGTKIYGSSNWPSSLVRNLDQCSRWGQRRRVMWEIGGQME